MNSRTMRQQAPNKRRSLSKTQPDRPAKTPSRTPPLCSDDPASCRTLNYNRQAGCPDYSRCSNSCRNSTELERGG